MSKEKKPLLYIANDIETSGPRLGRDSILSWGACVVTPEALAKAERQERGMVYYDELQPLSDDFVYEAMKVGCLGLRCVNIVKREDPRYDASSPFFRPHFVLEELVRDGTPPEVATMKLAHWLMSWAERTDSQVELVTDTVIFDASFLNYYFQVFRGGNPYGHAGLDLDSYYRGFCKSRSANLKNLGIVDDREVPHCAEDDAIFLAKLARELLYVRSTA